MKYVTAALLLSLVLLTGEPAFAATCKVINKQLVCDEWGIGSTDNRGSGPSQPATAPQATSPSAPSTRTDYPTTASFADELAGNPDQAQAAEDRKTQQKIEELTDKGETLGCGSAGEYGGSMSNALGNSFDNTIRDIVGSGVQALRGKAQDFINTIAQKAGPAAPFVQAVAQKVMPLVDKTLSDLGNKALGALGINTGSLGNVAQALGITGGAGAALSSALSAAGLSGVAGVAGGVGLSVPVQEIGTQLNETQKIREYSTKIEAHTEIVKQMQKLFGYVTCVANPAIAKDRNALLAEQNKKILEITNGQLIQEISAVINSDREYALKKVLEDRTAGMCSQFRADVQRIALGQIQYNDDFARQSQCAISDSDAAAREKGELGPFEFARSLFNLNNSGYYNVLTTIGEANRAVSEVASRDLLEYQKNVGYGNKIECRDDREVPVGGYCMNGRIVAHGASFAQANNEALQLPTDQLVQADEIGELIDTLSQGLMQFAFQNVEGLLGLGQDSGDEGSYLDQMVNASYSRDDVQTTITDDLQGALVVEEQYFDLVSLILSDFTTVRTTYESVKTCYAPFVTTPSANISTTLATDTMHLASTTITTLAPEITEFTALRNDSQLALDEMSFLIERAQAALTQEDMVSVSNDFSALRASGVMHNATDLQYLETSARASVETIELLLLDGQIKLNVCKGS